MLNGSFNRLFSTRELKEIKGSGNRNYKILMAILFATFSAITIADGGLKYLRYKMSDPFVKNLEVIIPHEKGKSVNTLKFNLNQDSLRSRYDYDTVMSHVGLSLKFWSDRSLEYIRAQGRSIEHQNPILEQIVSESNLLRGRSFRDEFDCGFIVTRKLLEELGYAEETFFVEMAIPKVTKGDYNAPVPIIAVVEELPGLASFAFTPYFYKVRNFSGFNNPFSLDKYEDLNLFIPSRESSDIDRFVSQMETVFASHVLLRNLEPDIEPFTNEDTYVDGTLLNILFYPEPSTVEELDQIYNVLENSEELIRSGMTFARYYNYDFPIFPEGTITYDRISILFSSLRNVRDFKSYLFNQFELDVEMSKIRDKENFVAMSILTITMVVILLLFSVFSVALFIYNLLRSHFMKIRMNLGTFKAFGLSNYEIQNVYRNIIRRFCLASMGISLSVVFILDQMIVVFFLEVLSSFHMFNLFLLITIAAILVSVEWTVRITSERLLKNTPGDLIYGRDVN
jgi:hypothetical protein